MEPTAQVWEIQLAVSPQVYPLEVIYRVCYHFTDRYYLWLAPLANSEIQVSITPKSAAEPLRDIRGAFGNALIDYALRRSVAHETRHIRDVIVSAALAEAWQGPHDAP